MAPPDLALAFKRGAELLLLPPASPLLLVVIGLAWARRRAGAGYALAWMGIAVALLSSSLWVGQWLIAGVERSAGEPFDEAGLRALRAGPDAPTALVILGGGARSNARERPEVDAPNARTTERLVHGAWVARVTGLPVLVSGGSPDDRPAEAVLMKRMLETRLGTTVRWVEDRSLDTADNARESSRLLRAAGHRRVLLVTHAYHMPRAMRAFEAEGLRPVPAPHGFLGTRELSSTYGWLPSAQGVHVTWLAAHEATGQIWYGLRGPLARAGEAVSEWFETVMRAMR